MKTLKGLSEEDWLYIVMGVFMAAFLLYILAMSTAGWTFSS